MREILISHAYSCCLYDCWTIELSDYRVVRSLEITMDFLFSVALQLLEADITPKYYVYLWLTAILFNSLNFPLPYIPGNLYRISMCIWYVMVLHRGTPCGKFYIKFKLTNNFDNYVQQVSWLSNCLFKCDIGPQYTTWHIIRMLWYKVWGKRT